jgi:DSF synthase
MDRSLELLQRRLGNLKVTLDSSHRAVWVEFNYTGRPCFSTALLDDVSKAQRAIRQAAQLGYKEHDDDRLLFQVLASADRDVFSLGGDLSYFIKLIEAGDRAGMQEYAELCVQIQYATATHYEVPFTNIALVEGEALGGGFEAALSANVMIAERKARFGFPEITFGMFPGMGAISLLIRKVTPAVARRLIMDHRIYTATELYDMGILDVLVPDGEGRAATMEYMQRHMALAPGHHGFQAAMDRALPLGNDELADVVDLWVEAAMQLTDKNLRLMKYFARAQENRNLAEDVAADSETSKTA